MKIFIENHSFHYEIENLTRIFFPNQKLEIIKNGLKNAEKPYILTSLSIKEDNAMINVAVNFDDFSKNITEIIDTAQKNFDDTCELKMAQMLYILLKEY